MHEGNVKLPPGETKSVPIPKKWCTPFKISAGKIYLKLCLACGMIVELLAEDTHHVNPDEHLYEKW